MDVENNKKTWVGFLLATFVAITLFPSIALSARIKDIAYFEGVRENQLMGYGLVVGLDGTGDYGRSEFTMQSISSMLSRMGIKIDDQRIQTRNAAAVMVTADLPPFARSGQKLDVTVSSLGNARSLQGGTLLMTPLRGPDQKVYAMAQGPLSIGGYEVNAGAGNTRRKNHVTAGRVPNGAIVERGVGFKLQDKEELKLVLNSPDFTTATNVSDAINAEFGADDAPIAKALNASTIEIGIPEDSTDQITQFISGVEVLDVERNREARVVINERTGTVVLGGNVEISEVAVAHENLQVRISTQYQVSQPGPFGQGETAVVPQRDVQVDEETAGEGEGEGQAPEEEPLNVVAPGDDPTIGDIANALNAVGASPRDLISIIQAIKSAGALNAEIEIQ
jgi:flagellar P-ring protein precursor FlgI